MSTELHIRLWLGPGSARERLQRIAGALLRWPQIEGGWQALRRGRPGHSVTLQEIAQFPFSIPVNTADADFLSTGIAARAWRFEGRVAVAGAVRLGVDAWEDGHPQRPDRALDGDACLWFQHAGPFVAALREGYAEADARVEENLEALNALLLLLIQEIQPDRLAVYTDAGFHHPLNAHAVYHRRRAGFMEDLALIRRLWREGAPGWRVAPRSARRPRVRGDGRVARLQVAR